MDTDPPDAALAAAIVHGNEVFGLSNDGGKASGEDLNEDGGEESGEEASLQKPKPNPKKIHNTVGFRKSKRCLSRHKKGQQKKTTHDFSARSTAIDIPNANAQKIASALVGDHKLRDSYRSPTKAYVNRERISLKRAFDHLKTSH